MRCASSRTTRPWSPRPSWTSPALYDITAQLNDAEVATQVSAVGQVFTKGGANIKDIAPSLKELHDLLRARNADFAQASFWQRQLGEQDQRSRALLAGFAKDVSGEFHILGLVTMPKLRQLARGARIPDSIPDTELAAAATKEGLQVVPEIAKPTVSVPSSVASDLVRTTCASLVQAIFLDQAPDSFAVLDGFRANNGVALTLKQVTHARDLTDLRQSNDNDWIKKALNGVLMAAKTDADLQALLVAHFIDLGRKAARASTLQVLALKALTETGLDRRDAARILLQFSDVGDTAKFADVPAMVASGRLREARRLFDALVSQTADGRDRRADEGPDRTGTGGGARRHSARPGQGGYRGWGHRGRGPGAGRGEHALCRRRGPGRGGACTAAVGPAPPVGRANPDGRAAVVTWSPGFGSTDDVRYRVLRKLGTAPRNAQDGEVVTDRLTDTRFEDLRAPITAETHYAVAASRGGGYSPVATDAITLLPPVSDVTVSAELTSIALRWSTPPEARSVAVLQISPDGSRRPVPVNAHSGASVSDLSTGTTYTYVLTAQYTATDGTEVGSNPVRVVGVPRGTARAVPSMSLRQCGDVNGTAQVEATWQEITGFRVEVWSFAHPPSWPYGTRVAMSALAGPGRRLTGAAADNGRRQGVRGPAEPGLRHYVAVTRDGDDGIIGQRQEFGICPPLQGVRGERFNDVVLLSWEWPGDEFDVRVRWSGPGGSGETSVSRVQYGQQGGLRIPAGTAGTRFVLTTVPADATDQWASNGYTLEVPAAAAALRYAVKFHRRPFRPVEVALTFSASGPVGRVGVVVVGKEGTVMPSEPERRDRRRAPRHRARRCPWSRLSTVTLPKLGRHFWVRAFSAEPGEVRLDQTPRRLSCKEPDETSRRADRALPVLLQQDRPEQGDVPVHGPSGARRGPSARRTRTSTAWRS